MKKAAGGNMSMENSKKDMAQDKATVKKAFRMHDAQEHKGERTDLSKLKKGGMTKKFAAGGITKQMPTSKGMGNMNMAEGGKVKKFPIGGLATAPGMRPGGGMNMPKPGGMGLRPDMRRGGPPPTGGLFGGGQAAPRGPGMPTPDNAPPSSALSMYTSRLNAAPNTGPMTQQGMADMAGMAQQQAASNAAVQGFKPAGFKKGGKIMAKKACGGKMAAGGSFRSAADGVAKKGKTKGTDVKMYAKGGSVSPDGCAVKGKTRAAGFR